jgi:hypothetical protein
MALLTCPVYEVLYGGARGGGKSDGMLGEWVAHAGRHGEDASGLVVRRERTQLYDLIERSKQLYAPLGAKFADNVWRFPNKARLRFAYLESDSDADAYQGHSYTRVYAEEIGTFPREAPIKKLKATLRSAKGVPVGFRATANPGGAGHQWVKARYIDPAPQGWKVFKDPDTGLEIVYIPARLSDNKLLNEIDPAYAQRLKGAGSAQLVKAWLEGDWNVVAGAYFPEFSTEQHVVAPFELPEYWPRIRAGDWGSAKPFCFLWLAVSDGSLKQFPRGSLVVYREWYGWNGNPNEGCKMNAVDVGRQIKAFDATDIDNKARITDEVLDPAAFAQDGGPSIAERMDNNWRPADNARVARAGAMGGWDQVRERLQGDEGRPMLYIFSTCTHLIRTLPALQHDQHRAEDVDTDAEDHAADALRYGCMSRPWVRDAPNIPKARFDTDITIDELIKRARKKRLAQE